MLLADANVAAYFSTRVYWGKLPQQPTWPAITLEQVSSNPHNALNSLPGLLWSRVRIHAWGSTYEMANAGAMLIETALNGATYTTTGLVVRSVVAQGLRDFYEPAVEAFHVSQDFSIWHSTA